MANDNHSFDLVSKVDFQEVNNAIQQSLKEIFQRFDLKDSNSEIVLLEKEKKIHLKSQDEYKVGLIYDILSQKLVKRGISAKALKRGKIESALGGTAKEDIEIQQGISKEKAKEIVGEIKKHNPKLQSQIQDEQIRITSKKIDELQSVIKILKEKDFDIPLQFINYR